MLLTKLGMGEVACDAQFTRTDAAILIRDLRKKLTQQGPCLWL